MKIFKDEAVLDSNGLFVYPPKPEKETVTFSYNGIVLPPMPRA